MRRHLVVTILATALSLCAGAASSALAAKPKLGVLGIEPIDEGDTAAVEKTTQIAKWFTDGLRASAKRASSKYDWAAAGNKELGELKLLKDCLDETKECMSNIGKDLGADRLMYGHVERSGKTYTVTLQMLNVATKKFEGDPKSWQLTSGQANEEHMKKLASSAFSEMTGIGGKGSIVLQANVDTGVVYVDGVAVTALANGKATIPDLDAGTYTIVIEAEGHRRFEVEVPVGEGQTQRVPVQMEREIGGGGGGGGGGAVRPGGTSRALFWTTLVVTAGGVAAFTITGIKVQDYEDEKLNAIRMSGGMIVSNSSQDACAEASTKMYAPVTNPCSDGKQMATVTNILIGATALVAVASAYFYYKGYIAAGNAEPRDSAARRKKSKSRQVVVVPEIYPSGAGLGAVIQF